MYWNDCFRCLGEVFRSVVGDDSSLHDLKSMNDEICTRNAVVQAYLK